MSANHFKEMPVQTIKLASLFSGLDEEGKTRLCVLPKFLRAVEESHCLVFGVDHRDVEFTCRSINASVKAGDCFGCDHCLTLDGKRKTFVGYDQADEIRLPHLDHVQPWIPNFVGFAHSQTIFKRKNCFGFFEWCNSRGTLFSYIPRSKRPKTHIVVASSKLLSLQRYVELFDVMQSVPIVMWTEDIHKKKKYSRYMFAKYVERDVFGICNYKGTLLYNINVENWPDLCLKKQIVKKVQDFLDFVTHKSQTAPVDFYGFNSDVKALDGTSAWRIKDKFLAIGDEEEWVDGWYVEWGLNPREWRVISSWKAHTKKCKKYGLPTWSKPAKEPWAFTSRTTREELRAKLPFIGHSLAPPREIENDSQRSTSSNGAKYLGNYLKKDDCVESGDSVRDPKESKDSQSVKSHGGANARNYLKKDLYTHCFETLGKVAKKRNRKLQSIPVPQGGVARFVNSVNNLSDSLQQGTEFIKNCMELIVRNVKELFPNRFSSYVKMFAHLKSFLIRCYIISTLPEDLRDHYTKILMADAIANFSLGLIGTAGDIGLQISGIIPQSGDESNTFILLAKSVVSSLGFSSLLDDRELLRLQRQLAVVSSVTNLIPKFLEWFMGFFRKLGFFVKYGWKTDSAYIAEMFATLDDLGTKTASIGTASHVTKIYEKYRTIIETDEWKEEREKHIEKIKTLVRQYAGHLGNAWKLKQRPVVVMAQGRAGSGKSQMTDRLFRLVHGAMGEDYDPSSVYTKSPTTQYYDGYDENLHTKLVIDDFSLLTTTETMTTSIDEFIRVASEASAPLDMAALESKGVTFFRSGLIYMTSNAMFNREDIAAGRILADKMALTRRFDFIVEIDSAAGDDYKLRWSKGAPTYNSKLKKWDFQPMNNCGSLEDLSFEVAMLWIERKRELEEKKRLFESMNEVKQSAAAKFKRFKMIEEKYPKMKPIVWELNRKAIKYDEFVKKINRLYLNLDDSGKKIVESFETVTLSDPHYEFFNAMDETVSAHVNAAIDGRPPGTSSQALDMHSILQKIDDMSFCEAFVTGFSIGAALGMLFKGLYLLFQWIRSKFSRMRESFNWHKKTTTAILPEAYMTDGYVGEIIDDCKSGEHHSHQCEDGHVYTHNNRDACPKCDFMPMCQSVSSATLKKGQVKVQSVSNAPPKKNAVICQSYSTGDKEKAFKDIPKDSPLIPFLNMYTPDYNAIAAHRATAGNCIQIHVDNGLSVRGLIVESRLVVTVGHIFPSKGKNYTVLVDGKAVRGCRFTLTDDQIYRVDKQDVAFFNLPTSYPPARSIKHHFSNQIHEHYTNGFMSIALYEQNTNWVTLRNLFDIRPMSTQEEWSATLSGVHCNVVVSRGYTAKVETFAGDCGSPIYVNDRNAPRKILGIHVAGVVSDGTSRICVVTYDDIMEAIEFFKPKPQCGSTTFDGNRQPDILAEFDFMRQMFDNNDATEHADLFGHVPLEHGDTTFYEFYISEWGMGPINPRNQEHQSALHTLAAPFCIFKINRGYYSHHCVKFFRNQVPYYAHLVQTEGLSAMCVVERYRPSIRHEFVSSARDVEGFSPLAFFERLEDWWDWDDSRPTERRHEFRPWNPCDLWSQRLLFGTDPQVSGELMTSIFRGISEGIGIMCQADGVEEDEENATLLAFKRLFMEKEDEESDVSDVEFYDCVSHEAGEVETFEHFAYVKEIGKRFVGGDNPIVESPIHGAFPVTQYPTKVRSGTVNGVRVNPIFKQMQKGNVARPTIPSDFFKVSKKNLRHLMRQAEIKHIEQIGIYEKRVWSTAEAINGLKTSDGVQSEWALPMCMKTSAGYPYVLAGKPGKTEVFERKGTEWVFRRNYEKEFDEMNNKILNGDKPESIMVPCLKCELREKEKVENLETRVFIICDCMFIALIRKYFGSFLAVVMAIHNDFECSVGLNVHSDEATRLAKRLFLGCMKKYIAGDYKSWDKLLHFEIAMLFVEFVNDWYDDEFKEARILLGEMMFAGLYMIEGTVFQIHGMMPSGVPVTAVGNSICNSLLLRVAFCNILHEQGMSADLILNSLLEGSTTIACYGDDHVVALVDSLTGHLDMHRLKKWLERYNIGYTAPDKTDVLPLFMEDHNLTYLKREFTYHLGGFWKMPLKRTVIWDIANWQQKSLGKAAALRSNYDAMAIELVHHGEDEFHSDLAHYREKAAQCFVSLPEYDFDVFSAKIARTATTLGYTSNYSQLIGLLATYLTKEHHHVYSYVKNRLSLPFFRWCPYFVGKGPCRGGSLLDHHLCLRCGRTALHVDEENPRMCLECLGMRDVPEWYYHDVLDCAICKAELKHPVFKLFEAYKIDDQDIRRINEEHYIDAMWSGRDYGSLFNGSLNEVVGNEEDFQRIFRRKDLLVVPSKEVEPSWTLGRVERNGINHLLTKFKFNNKFNFIIRPPLTERSVNYVLELLENEDCFDVVLVTGFENDTPMILKRYVPDLHGKIKHIHYDLVPVEFCGNPYGERTMIWVNLVKE